MDKTSSLYNNYASSKIKETPDEKTVANHGNRSHYLQPNDEDHKHGWIQVPEASLLQLIAVI